MILTIYFAIRFYKNLYTDEGYLMHTLPVKPWMLIVSKLTIGTIWFYLIDLLLVGAITLITLIALPTMAYFSPEDLLELRTMFQSYHTIFTVPSILFLAIPVMIISSVFQPQGARIHPVLSRAEHHPFDRYDASDYAYDRRRVHPSIDFCESDD